MVKMMAKPPRKADTVQLECVNRISNIPLVETSWIFAGNLYQRLKDSNSLTSWSLSTAEGSINAVMQNTLPTAFIVFGRPISVFDKLVCKSLDVMEERVPAIYLPPQIIYRNTKRFMEITLVKPVLNRADSVKILGTNVLSSKYTEFAIDKVEQVINIADRYVDKCFPPVSDNDENELKQKGIEQDENCSKIVKIMNHVNRLTQKVQRRLSEYTPAEVQMFKEQSQQVFKSLIIFIINYPKIAVSEVKKFWADLGEDDPKTFQYNEEQLLIALIRQVARRFVHMVSYFEVQIVNLPKTVTEYTNDAAIYVIHFADTFLKTIRIEEMSVAAINELKFRMAKLRTRLNHLNATTNNTLEKIILILAGGSSPAVTNSTSVSRVPIRTIVIQQSPQCQNNNHRSDINNVNGGQNY